jgi:hypothetical protein
MVSPPCPQYTSSCLRIVSSIRLDAMECLDGTPCYNSPTPPCCYDIGIVELVARCGGDAGCIRYYSNTATYFPELSVDSDLPPFDWSHINQGFKDSFFIFLFIFTIYCIVKVLNLPAK